MRAWVLHAHDACLRTARIGIACTQCMYGYCMHILPAWVLHANMQIVTFLVRFCWLQLGPLTLRTVVQSALARCVDGFNLSRSLYA